MMESGGKPVWLGRVFLCFYISVCFSCLERLVKMVFIQIPGWVMLNEDG